ncbi:MAG: cellulase family glycosylhydrolase [Lentisphaerae bacterium]|jgi:endoglucanase|nr:cellulase family glycosylhydrolase [Lentisphaerota bacterium]MBT4815422.1 cellulase family glycosylhydrolase [Lentisphaerota bacterium]MBT5609232.1 cellulase family glycosylhydrolase [Lentisphaerota bacterium]MBT7059889.1 cellulase family glycosylhydrolase [Lentisphaerota bacterium]MBT7847122.1 cellulase family glycosylhydrolase [Lentisphaerota bacterium]
MVTINRLLIAGIAFGTAMASSQEHGTAQGQPKPGRRRGELVFRSNFEDARERTRWSTAPCAQWISLPERGMCLRTTVAEAGAGEGNMIKLPLDVSRFGDCWLNFECWAKADAVSKPAHTYNGVKFMFHHIASDGPHWQNENGVHGTFDWRRLMFSAPIPENVSEAWLLLGLQESSGTVHFDDIRVTVKHVRPVRPQPKPNAPPPFRGHSLPRLRGAMSPNTFRDEDLRIFGKAWNANLIRWQMTTKWGADYKHGLDYDSAKYDAWLKDELADLDKVLDACLRYGILAVVDLHSPPGGRRPNRDLVILHERKYLESFVAVWRKIARRYKGNQAVWGYDLVNEPVQNKPSPDGMPDYLGAQVLAAKAIRAIDPERPIIIEVDHWDSAEGFKFLEPVEIPNVVYQVHMYYPHQFTHQGVHGSPTGVLYPGKIGAHEYDKEALRKHLAPVREFQLAYNVHIYVGEFSAIRWAPDNSAFRYLGDCIEIFEEYGWDWSYHAFREWDGWSVEHNSNPDDHSRTDEPTKRKALLLKWFARNEKP